uniref:Uncharacterized protein n=1 Tax=Arundo donax TaxID=35708 RepID=A0A0A8ZNL3_ARUDO
MLAIGPINFCWSQFESPFAVKCEHLPLRVF